MHLYTLQHPHSRAAQERCKCGNKGAEDLLPLPGFELETSGSDTMLSYMHQPIQPKNLSFQEEVGNALIHTSTILMGHSWVVGLAFKWIWKSFCHPKHKIF